MAKTRKWSRLPTPEEILAFDGIHCGKTYLEVVRTSWRCPSCRRTAEELIRWSEIKGPFWRSKYGDEYGMGWTTSLTRHHCHAGLRFSTTLVCGDCNSADGAAKRKLGLPESWSFTPEEIGLFVKVAPYSGKTTIDYEIASAIFRDASRAGHV